MSIPYMPLFVADYEADTAHLSPEEDGVYMRLLRLCWRTPGCSVPDDAAWIARMMRVSPEFYAARVAPIIDEFMEREKGRVFSARLQREFARVTKSSKLRSEAGKKGGRPSNPLKYNGLDESRAFVEKSPAKANGKHLDPEPDKEKRDTNVSPSTDLVGEFERVWRAYPKKVERKAAYQAWLAARRRKSYDEIARPLWRYCQSRAGQDHHYTVSLGRWLKNERWEDEQSHASNAPTPRTAPNGTHHGSAEPTRTDRVISAAAVHLAATKARLEGRGPGVDHGEDQDPPLPLLRAGP
jgi:uncharacterized protein YdaU (DUF1376 family)